MNGEMRRSGRVYGARQSQEAHMRVEIADRRTTQLLLAAIIGSLLVNVAGLLMFLLPTDGDEEVPAGIVVVGIVLGVIALWGAWELWQRHRRGKWVTIVVTALNLLSTLPAFFVRPGTGIVIGAAVSVVVMIAVIVILLRKDVSALLR
jgi:hypothetical protein